MKNNKGFTLVELLAVITLLAILMGIAVPNITSTINNNKRNEFLSDAKRMIAKAEYFLSLDRDTRNDIIKNNHNKIYYFAPNSNQNSGNFLNEKNEFSNDPEGAEYDAKSYVKIEKGSSGSTNSFKYCICLVGSKKKIGASGVDTCKASGTSDCVYSTDLTGIDIVKDK